MTATFKTSLYIFLIFNVLSCVSKKPIGLKSITLANVENIGEIESAIQNGYENILVKNSTIKLEKSLELKSNLSIHGENLKFIISGKNKVHKIYGKGLENVKLINFEIYDKINSLSLNHHKDKNPIRLDNCSNITIKSIKVTNSINSAIVINDCKNVEILYCTFLGIGRKNTSAKYNYDAIYINSYNSGSQNILIDNCLFKNIGTNNTQKYKEDGDGIQTYAKNGNISQLVITNNKFENISRRAIKIQTGKNIEIKNNTFNNIKMAIGFAMENNIHDVNISQNIFKNCYWTLQTDCLPNMEYTLNTLKFEFNKIENSNGIFRTSGKSKIQNSIISHNQCINTGAIAIDGLFKYTKIIDNVFNNYHLKMNPKVKNKYCIVLWNSSENTIIKNNTFQNSKKEIGSILIYPKTKGIEFTDNKFNNSTYKNLSKN